ncbi:Protein CBR-TAG-266 [Caenorhabditis briggsae]|uniref:Protein CBR-TAG-266 n=1 Tax=Caenorhabditis briggsae TaxID=6238 RepID=A8XLK3_CAEBR|nr:Protein CBR-TAG-266 [Caenorhabditis briggsae]CAP33507.2 Protein CBR-TAG-266 [Caenorhabditis briggsae]
MSQVSPAPSTAPPSASASSDVEEPEIDVIASSDDESEPIYIHKEKDPIVIRGVGNITVFGMNSRFNTEYPPELTGYIAPEELSATLSRVNSVLKRHVQTSSRWLLCGLAFCCCSLGCSMWPVICLNRRTVIALEKCLDHENVSLYHKLGLHWSLARRPTEPSDRLTEYVLELKILPKAALNIPD